MQVKYYFMDLVCKRGVWGVPKMRWGYPVTATRTWYHSWQSKKSWCQLFKVDLINEEEKFMMESLFG